jgi:uncharacterized protein YbjT (DUF2867 family)
MRVVVIGGTGFIGSRLVAAMRADGDDAVAASPGTGVDTITGAGLREALVGASAVVDVSNSPTYADDVVREFFRTSTRNVLAAEAAVGVAHHVVLSIVGTSRLPDSTYYRAKQEQEALVDDAAVASTIVRATQFFEFLPRIADTFAVDGDVRVPPVLVQPMAAGDVVAALAASVRARPTVPECEVAGPERFRFDELLQRVLQTLRDHRLVITDPDATYFGGHLNERTLVPEHGAQLGTLRVEDWLATQARPETARFR